MKTLNTVRVRRSRHLRPVTAAGPIWDALGPGVTDAFVHLMIVIEIFKTDKASATLPENS